MVAGELPDGAVVVGPAGTELVGEEDGTDVGGVEAEGWDGSRPAGFEMRNCRTAVADTGFGMVVPFGKNASVISCPFLKRRSPGLFFTSWPFVSLGDFHVITRSKPFLPMQLSPLRYTFVGGFGGTVVVGEVVLEDDGEVVLEVVVEVVDVVVVPAVFGAGRVRLDREMLAPTEPRKALSTAWRPVEAEGIGARDGSIVTRPWPFVVKASARILLRGKKYVLPQMSACNPTFQRLEVEGSVECEEVEATVGWVRS